MSSLPEREWHPHSKPPLSSWLDHAQSRSAKRRLHQVGSCVMPDLCHFGLNILGHELRRNGNF